MILHRLFQPFRTQIFYHQRTRIEYRVFPPKLDISACPSIQDRIDANEGITVLGEPTIIVGNRIVGARERFKVKEEGEH